jgi:ribonuclease HI
MTDDPNVTAPHRPRVLVARLDAARAWREAHDLEEDHEQLICCLVRGYRGDELRRRLDVEATRLSELMQQIHDRTGRDAYEVADSIARTAA